MTAEVDPSARVQVRGLGSLLAPATCAMCGNGTQEEYVDPAIFYDWEGQVYFCKRCTTEMAETIGCLSPEQADFLKSVNDELAARNAELEEVAAKYAELRIALGNVGLGDLSSSASSASGASPSQHDADKREHKISNDEPTIDRTEQGANAVKSVAVRRRNDAARPTGSDKPTPPSKSGLNI